MLQTAGTTVRSRRKHFNRPRSISPFSSRPLEVAESDTHKVTDSFHGYWVYPSSPPPGFVPLLGYSYSPFTRLAPYCLRPPSDCHGRAPRLCSVVVLHWVGGGCQRLGFLSSGCNVTMVVLAPAPPLFFFHCRLLRVFTQCSINYFILLEVHGKGFPVDSSPCIYLYFSFRPPSRRGISYFAWLVCGWSRTRETWVDGFFAGAGWYLEVFLDHS